MTEAPLRALAHKVVVGAYEPIHFLSSWLPWVDVWVTGWVAMGLIALYLFPKPLSTIASALLITVGLLNGPSRLMLGKHWPSDVFGAWLLASGWLLLCWSAFLWFWAPRPKDARSPDGLSDRSASVADS